MTSRKENLILAAIAVLILAMIAGTGYWIWAKFAPPREENKISITDLNEEPKTEESKNKNNIQAESASSADKEAAPPAVEEKTILPAEVSVKVLNGGAAAGNAGKVKDLLKTKGYAKTEAANANLSSYTGVAIYYKTEFKSEAEKIKEALAGQYKTIALKEGANIQEINGDIVIILGK